MTPGNRGARCQRRWPIDLLKVSHHGQQLNFAPFMEALSPSMIVRTGSEKLSPERPSRSVIPARRPGSPMEGQWLSARILPDDFGPTGGISSNDVHRPSGARVTRRPRARWFREVAPRRQLAGGRRRTGAWYYFADAHRRRLGVGQRRPMVLGGWTGAMVTDAWVVAAAAGIGSARPVNRSPAGSRSTAGTTWAPAVRWIYRLGSIDGSWYYMDANGVATGWLRLGSSWYYMGEAPVPW